MKRSLLVRVSSFVSILAFAAAVQGVAPAAAVPVKNFSMPIRSSIETEWHSDFDAAAKVAKEQKKDLLVDFTGSGWCGWCTKLHDEVFVQEAFLKAAREKYVLVALDFEQSGKSKADQPNPARNEELKAKHHVRGFPTVLLVTPEGHAFAQTGYRPDGAQAYVAHLAEVHEAGKQRLEELLAGDREVRAAKGEERGAKLDDAIAKLEAEPEDSIFRSVIAATVKVAIEPGSQEARERQIAAAKALIGAGVLDDTVGAAVAALDPKNEQGLREDYVLARCNAVTGENELRGAVAAIEQLEAAGAIQDPKTAEQIYANAAWWHHKYLQQPEKAKKYAQKAKDLGSANPRLAAILEQILNS